MGINETSEGWEVIGLHGNELENSPYDSERSAKQAFNAHKMGYDGDDDSDDASDDDDQKNSIDIDQNGENNNSGDSDSSFMSLLGNKYVVIGLGVAGAYLLLKERDSEAGNVEVEDDIQDSEGSNGGDDDKTQDNLDAGRQSAADVLS